MAGSITLNSSISSLQTQRRLGEATSSLKSVSERLSSGQRINRASDDAAGLAIADSLRANVRISAQAIRNGNDGISMLSIADGATEELQNIVTRVQELAEEAANGVYSNKQRLALDSEAQQLVSEYNRIVATTTFNGTALLANQTAVDFQVGTNSAASSRIGVSVGIVSSICGDGTFKAESNITAGNPSRNVISGDFNGDRHADIAYTGSGGSQVILGNGDGTFQTAINYAVGVGTSYSNEIKSGDLNGDGALDLIVPGYYSSAVSVLIGNGNGTFKAALLLPTGVNAWEAEVADFNNDGNLDIVSMSNGETVRWTFLGNGNGTFKSSISAVAPGYQLASGDVNGDGKLDLVAPGQVYLGNGDGNFGIGSTFTLPGGGRSPSLIDLNGDGVLDYASSSSGGTFSIAIGNSNGSFKNGISYTTGTQSAYDYQLTAGDLNGDGKADIIISESGGNSLSVFLNGGDGTFAVRVSYSTPAGGESSTLADFNEDGALDIAQGKTSASQVGLFLGNPVFSPNLLNVNLRTRLTALDTLDSVKQTGERISKKRGEFGAFQSRLSAAVSNAQVSKENEQAAESQIRDADVAQEAAVLARVRILQQAGAAILAQANKEPEIALKLLSSAG